MIVSIAAGAVTAVRRVIVSTAAGAVTAVRRVIVSIAAITPQALRKRGFFAVTKVTAKRNFTSLRR